MTLMSLQVVLKHDIRHPTSVVVVEDMVIWSEAEKSAVFQANKWTGKDRKKIVRLNSRMVFSMAVMHPHIDAQPALHEKGNFQSCICAFLRLFFYYRLEDS